MKNLTNILPKVDWNILNDYIDNGLIVKNKHPEYNIWILNYSSKVQAQKLWDEYTSAARGLVIDADGNILARGYKKFFNYEEIFDKEWFPKNPISDYEIYTKEDGSLGIIFNYNNKWIITTRGSFKSEQAIKATEILNKYDIDYLDKSNTYLVEIIYPLNMIVVNYFGKETLILHGIIRNCDGYLFTYNELINHISTNNINFDIIKQHNFINDILILKNRNIENEEGYVLRLKNTDFLMKLKFKTYIEKHSILTKISSKEIWRYLQNNLDLNEIINVVPDEIYGWVKKWIVELTNSFEEIENLNREIYNEIINKKPLTKKEFALLNLSIKRGNSSIRFMMYEKKSYSNIIWKLIEPNYEKPFQLNEEDN